MAKFSSLLFLPSYLFFPVYLFTRAPFEKQFNCLSARHLSVTLWLLNMQQSSANFDQVVPSTISSTIFATKALVLLLSCSSLEEKIAGKLMPVTFQLRHMKSNKPLTALVSIGNVGLFLTGILYICLLSYDTKKCIELNLRWFNFDTYFREVVSIALSTNSILKTDYGSALGSN